MARGRGRYITDNLRASYDRVAEDYAAQFVDELDHKPLDRALLDSFASEVRGKGPIGDIGCGPGQVGRYLHDRGLEVIGVDLSPEMVASARLLHPDMTFLEGSMLDLPVKDAAWAGFVAFYSVIHLPPEDRPRAFAELHRVLQPGGLALIAFHVGTDTVHLEEWWEKPVSLDFHFLTRETLLPELEAAGFTVQAYLERQPYEPHEHPSTRGYLLAKK